jgi:hypothetical protein
VSEGFEAAATDRRRFAFALLDDLVRGVRREFACFVGLGRLSSDQRVLDEFPLGGVFRSLLLLLRAFGHLFVAALSGGFLGFLGFGHVSRLANRTGLGAVETAVEVASGQEELTLFADDLVCLSGSGDEHGCFCVSVTAEIDATATYEVFEEGRCCLVVAG